MAAELEEIATWVEIASGMTPLVKQYPDFSLFALVRKRFWQRRSYRANRPLPVSRIEFSQNTWEVCLHAPGLLKENDVESKTMSLSDFHERLTSLGERASHCTLVLSDQRCISRSDLSDLARREGEWSGPPINEIEDDELVARLDLPIQEMGVFVLPEEGAVHLKLKC